MIIPPLQDDVFRAYDAAVVARFNPTLVTRADGTTQNQVPVPGCPAAVPIGVGMPEEWYATLAYPYIAVTRTGVVPAPARAMPAWRAQQLSTNPATPNTFNIQKAPPQPVNLMYTVELVADNMGAMNALMLYLVMTALPTSGYGTVLTVEGNSYGFQGTGSKDLTDYRTKDGRVFRHAFTYVVEGWLYTLECDKVTQVLHVDTSLETYGAKHPGPLTETTDPAEADLVETLDVP